MSPPPAPTVVQATKSKTALVIFVLVTLLLLAVGIAGYFYYQYHNTVQVKDAKEIEELTATIGKVMVLPEGETPTLATVTDKEKLAGQPFFQKSENGDKVLIYSQGGRAILYRPSTKKIVDVTTVNVNPQAAPTPTPTPTPDPQTPLSEPAQGGATPATLKVAIYNGSGVVGISSEIEKEIKASYPDATITTKETAVGTYDDTLAVDMTGKSPVLTESLSYVVKGKVASLPSEEKVPEGADVLVIIGKKH